MSGDKAIQAFAIILGVAVVIYALIELPPVLTVLLTAITGLFVIKEATENLNG